MDTREMSANTPEIRSQCIQTEEEILERKHFEKVIEAFLYYKTSSLRKLQKKESDFRSLPKEHQNMMPHVLNRISSCREAVDVNYKFLRNVIGQVDEMFLNFEYSPDDALSEACHPLTGDDMDRVRTTITQLVRDWAAEGAPERATSYSVILEELEILFPDDQCRRAETRVLVPGAGLGRLLFEVAKRGFSCQGNEFSLYMLFVSNYILNCCDCANMITIHPWIHQFNNVLEAGDQTRPVQIPDINPTEIRGNVEFSMVAGDFLEVYTQDHDWDCIVTCFFIDTAHDICSYIEKIYDLLKDGGYWINFGPLLYHFSDMPGETSVELNYKELKEIIVEKFKFRLVKEKVGMTCTYNQNPRSLLKMAYDCVFFVVQKCS